MITYIHGTCAQLIQRDMETPTFGGKSEPHTCQIRYGINSKRLISHDGPGSRFARHISQPEISRAVLSVGKNLDSVATQKMHHC